MITCQVVHVAENHITDCTREAVATLTWDNEVSYDVCDHHLVGYELMGGLEPTIEVWPRCTVEVLDPYDRVSLVDCGERADERHVCDFHRRMIGCS